MTRVIARHISGDLYIVDLDMETSGQPVLSAGGPYRQAELAEQDDFVLGTYKHSLDDFDLSSEDADWAEEEFEGGHLRVVPRGALL